MIGSIIYLVTGTQPHLIFGIFFLAQFSSALNMQYIVAVIGCLRYINRIGYLTLLFSYAREIVITRLSDSDYDNYIHSR
jgi:hypothetical protein